jgi:DNA polymerase/3'-5' exonuclease PolX
MNFSDASRIANDLAARFAPFCLRPPVVIGSIRRGKPEVKDCEILVYPDPKPPRPEFGKPIYYTGLDKYLELLESEGTLRYFKGGDVYRQYRIDIQKWEIRALVSFNLDLFIVADPSTWGTQMVIRTGPADFSQWCVTSKDKGGGFPNEYHFDEKNPWHVTWRDGTVRDMPEELDFLLFLGLGWIEPANRKANWRK